MVDDGGAGLERNRYPIDYQAVSYYSAPKSMEKKKSLDEVDPELLARSISSGFLSTSKSDCRMLPSAVFDSVSIGTAFKEDLLKAGVVFCSISEAVRDYPELVKEHLGSVVPVADNFSPP